MPDGVLIALAGETVGYDGRVVLEKLDFTVRRGERIAVMGRSGAGKSTLLNLLHGRLKADVALVPQAAALVKMLSVFHNVYMGRLDRNPTTHNLRTLVWPAKADVASVTAVLREVELEEKLFAKAGALSGGQQQRVSVARAIYNGRPVLLADEPVSALDRVQGAQILDLLRRRHETLILVLHDVPLALQYSDRIIVLEGGRKVIDAPTSNVTAADLFAVFGGRVA